MHDAARACSFLSELFWNHTRPLYEEYKRRTLPCFRCKITRTVGTGANVVGGSLTIAGGILTLTTGGLAAPLLIAGIATSSVGAATNVGSSVLEKIIASKQASEPTAF